MREFRVYGPPGTGKTTYLMERLRDAVAKRGGGHVRVLSFSRAAAKEIAFRALAGGDVAIPRENVTTLHAAMYRHLGSPPLAEAPELARDWNGSHAQTPQERVSPLAKHHATKDGDLEDQEGDEIAAPGFEAIPFITQVSLLRARMVPEANWDLDVRDWNDRWRAWKREQGAYDFSDLVEAGMDLDHAPGRPWVLFVDEAQDLSTMELAVIRKWGEAAQTFVLAGDDDQTIHTWRGASPDAMSSPELPTDQLRVLGQSYRLPRVIMDLALRYIKQVRRRVDKAFLPASHEGSILRIGATYEAFDEAVEIAKDRVKGGSSVMILASCGFMVDRIIARLRADALAFGNPYRVTQGRWNPLQRVSGRVKAYAVPILEARNWTWREMHRWVDVCSVKKLGLVSGAKTGIEELAKDARVADTPLTLEDLQTIFESDPPIPSPGHFADALLPGHQGILDYPLRVWETHGLDSVVSAPRITVGTIHSVKGAEADTVILCPDVSRRAVAEDADPDAVIRAFYVGMTRARRELVICSPVVESLSADF